MKYTLETNRNNLCDLMLACTACKMELQEEMNNPELDVEAREMARKSHNKWARLHDEIKAQIEAQDAKHAE